MNEDATLDQKENLHPFFFCFLLFNFCFLFYFSSSFSSYALFFVFLLERCSLGPLETWMAPHCLKDRLCWRWNLSTIPLPLQFPSPNFQGFQELQICYCLICMDRLGLFSLLIPLVLRFSTPTRSRPDHVIFIQWLLWRRLVLLNFCTFIFGKMLINITRIALKRKIFII